MTNEQLVLEVLERHHHDEWCEPMRQIVDEIHDTHNGIEISLKEVSAILKRFRELGFVECSFCITETGKFAGNINHLVYLYRRCKNYLQIVGE